MSTYTPIATQTLGSAAASVTFSSIPQGYTDLVVVINAICASGGADLINLQYNGDTTSGLYSSTRLVGNGSTVNSDRQTGANFIYAGLINSTVRNSDIYQIQNYSNGTTFKTCLARAGLADNQTRATVGLWRNTNAITSITLSHASSINFSAGSTFSIYGIQVGDKAQKAQGGNIVTSDGTYVYHTFTSSGAFIPSQALTVDYLVVAGGGGGGSNLGGGAGAGGLRSTVTATGGGGSLESALSLTAKAYPVIVGAGGAGGPLADRGVSGSNSIFSTITSTGGGGGGGGGSNSPGLTGGSGGGGGYYPSPQTGGTGTANQGYAGGNGQWVNAGYADGGGGGGAGAVGANGTTSGSGNGGAGGNGVAVAISGSSITYAGGGGGGAVGTAGAGGTGGGGAGASGTGSANGTVGTVNTGGGGGGSAGGGNGIGGQGGSGIVIIRYAL